MIKWLYENQGEMRLKRKVDYLLFYTIKKTMLNLETKNKYERNYAGDFSITKQDVKNIRDGKINDRILEKLDNDFGRIENDPQYAGAYTRKNINDDFIENKSHIFDENGNELLNDVALNNRGELIDSRGNVLFAKGADSLAGGVVAGVEQDENGNISINPAKFVAGFGGIMLAKKALSSLKSNKAKEILDSAIKQEKTRCDYNFL